MSFAIFRNLCPNCGAHVSADRLEAGFACKNCLSIGDLHKVASV
ncbi:MAG: hypothetical protein ABDI07_12225, partial [Candidatus Kryptonium sp.]